MLALLGAPFPTSARRGRGAPEEHGHPLVADDTPLLGEHWILEDSSNDARDCSAGRRGATAKECLAAVQEAASRDGLDVAGFKSVDEGAAGVVPAGCSYSLHSKSAMFNTNAAGGYGEGNYRLACLAPPEEGPSSTGPAPASKGGGSDRSPGDSARVDEPAEPHGGQQPSQGATNESQSAGEDARELPGQWKEVCAVERSRAIRYLGHETFSRNLSVPVGNQRPSSFDDFLRTLEALLLARGTLCSESQPCRVRPRAEGAGGSSQSFEICLSAPQASSLMCEAMPLVGDEPPFMLRKACARGADGRCFAFDMALIEEWVAQRRSEAALAAPAPASPLQPVKRCAVVMTGHTLRCGRPWGGLIDGPYYDTVLRANAHRFDQTSGTRSDPYHDTVLRANAHRFDQKGGRRTDLSREIPGPNGSCPLPAAPGGSSRCLTRKLLRVSDVSRRLHDRSGLGLGHSGGGIVDLAAAYCARVDVYGMGLYSAGPGTDALYLHYYDAKVPSNCASAPCWRGEKGVRIDRRATEAATDEESTEEQAPAEEGDGPAEVDAAFSPSP